MILKKTTAELCFGKKVDTRDVSLFSEAFVASKNECQKLAATNDTQGLKQAGLLGRTVLALYEESGRIPNAAAIADRFKDYLRVAEAEGKLGVTARRWLHAN